MFTITIRNKFSSFMELLPKDEFVQVHKSFAVAPKQIKSIEGNSIVLSAYKIPIGKMYKHNVSRLLN
ncbi:MAG: LytTR family transcriptional regulator [Bacteroidetes bacterium]|nr:LytTR family transcriptional regulator [Bacteroidota bacterium]